MPPIPTVDQSELQELLSLLLIAAQTQSEGEAGGRHVLLKQPGLVPTVLSLLLLFPFLDDSPCLLGFR